LPKNVLDEALSAQICSLSAKVADDCFEITTGGVHAALSPAPAAWMLSVRETPIPSKPFSAGPEVRFA
jgi:hypothetical protein